VSLSSTAHKFGRINFKDLNSERRYNPMMAYNQSKLADLMFALELQRRLDATGEKNTVSVSAHPGLADTASSKCQWTSGTARGRTWKLPVGGR
jgi:NAD(P)-dependent dehydrogenase (short-subunit alcohol dehydrogenase family)